MIGSESGCHRAAEFPAMPAGRAAVSEDLVHALLDAAPDAMITSDASGTILFVNTQAEILFGYPRSELLGQSIERILPESLRARHRALREGYNAAPEARPMGLDLDLFGQRKNGQEFPVEVSLSPIESEKGLLVTCAIRDVSARRQAEARLNAQFAAASILAESADLPSAAPRLLQAIGESLGCRWGGLWMISDARTELRCVELWHVPAPEMETLAEQSRRIAFRKGQGMPGRVWRSERPLWIPDLTADAEFLRTDPAVSSGLTTALGIPIQLDGEIVGVIEVLGCQLIQPATEVLATLESISRQISQFAARRRAEAQLRRQTQELARSNADLQQFAYVASHDLQEPLRMVASYAQLLARRYRGRLDSDADEFIDFLVDGATRMQQLIQDLLAYSRVGTGGKEFAPTDANAVVDQVIRDLAPTITESRATVTREDLPTLPADAAQLGQLFQNLIGNAIKYHGEDPPRVHVSARRQERGWLCSVSDNGIGIDPHYFERIFVIFQRLYGKADYPGTGIGLAICKKIVERHGGRIWVESIAGHGSTFSFTIPDHP